MDSASSDSNQAPAQADGTRAKGGHVTRVRSGKSSDSVMGAFEGALVCPRAVNPLVLRSGSTMEGHEASGHETSWDSPSREAPPELKELSMWPSCWKEQSPRRHEPATGPTAPRGASNGDIPASYHSPNWEQGGARLGGQAIGKPSYYLLWALEAWRV